MYFGRTGYHNGILINLCRIVWDPAKWGRGYKWIWFNCRAVVQRGQTLKYPRALITSVKILCPPKMLGYPTRRWWETDQDAFLFIPLSSVSEHIGTHRDAVNRWGTTCLYPVCFSWLARHPSARILNSWGLRFPFSCPGTLECTFWYCVGVMWNKSLKGLAWCLLIGV